MEHAKELLIQAVSTILFCLAVTLLFAEAKGYRTLLKAVKVQYIDEQELYFGEYNQENVTTYAELIASFCGKPEYDLEVDGFLIGQNEHTVDQIKNYPIPTGKVFRKSYAYDGNGRVTRIIYESVK